MSFGMPGRKKWVTAIAATLAVVVIAVIGVSWYYAGEVQSGAFEIERDETEYPLVITALAFNTVTLEAASETDDLDLPGLMGIESEESYGWAGPITTRSSTSVNRPFQTMLGRFDIGDRVRYDRSAYPDDPQVALGENYTEIDIPGPLGNMSAWEFPGRGDTWLIAVHGRTSDRTEALRLLAATEAWNMPTLVISYRNDEGEPEDPSGEYRFGISEWEDLNAAVKYATDAGAERLILAGLSMGGGVVAHYLDKGENTEKVFGLVLDAPMLNLTSALNHAADDRSVPQPIPFFAAWVSTLRYGVNWSDLDTRDIIRDSEVPILLFHGTGDKTIPVSDSRQLAEDVGSRVTYVEVEDAVHVGSWNVDPIAYEQAVDDWIATELGIVIFSGG